ncbi:PIR Superfamily Protein [Plasmodium ovale curtisi]|uniref:PIR Superfamily Protein n=1 Tax=Plasmodium ovale curtisi TaxID=864141 RepID=A0A1A8X6B3_PLAOA|nr:PIR Superfamily Protein [Plasmodium ovale curtisi]SBT00157.1 PIR Superfamily Protein [Plasmodium ovale curtisi]
MSDTEADIYSFFNNFETYIQYEQHMEKHYGESEQENECYSFIPDINISSTESANKICEKFKYLYKFIISTKTQPKTKILDNNDFAYLNYWFNCKLRNNMPTNKLTVTDFYENMSDHEVEFGPDTFDGKLYDLEYEDFNNMNLLSQLKIYYGETYKNMSAHINEVNIPCIQYFQKYITTYKEAIIKCPHDNTSFCKILNNFKEEYDKMFFGEFGISEKCADKEFLKLPTYNDVLQENQKITTVGTILGPSFATLFTSFFLYKFTPLRQWIRGKMGSKIGSHSNLYEENDELSLNTSDNENIKFDEIPYRISYDSVTNY